MRFGMAIHILRNLSSANLNEKRARTQLPQCDLLSDGTTAAPWGHDEMANIWRLIKCTFCCHPLKGEKSSIHQRREKQQRQRKWENTYSCSVSISCRSNCNTPICHNWHRAAEQRTSHTVASWKTISINVYRRVIVFRFSVRFRLFGR